MLGIQGTLWNGELNAITCWPRNIRNILQCTHAKKENVMESFWHINQMP